MNLLALIRNNDGVPSPRLLVEEGARAERPVLGGWSEDG